jgi:oligosaccharyltransferase complex subunit alpha (ribophorin I)
VLLSLVTPFVSFTLVYALPNDGSFENTAVVRTVELAGSTTHVTTSYQFKALRGAEKKYWFTLSEHDGGRTSWMEAKLKGSKQTLKVEQFGLTPKK